MKIYEHPLDNEITIVEIEKKDEKTSYLKPVLNGFRQFGTTYPSSSYDDKKVIYLDGRIRNNEWINDTEILIMLAAQVGTLNAIQCNSDPWKETLRFVEGSGDIDTLNAINSRGSDYFEVFKTTYHVDK